MRDSEIHFMFKLDVSQNKINWNSVSVFLSYLQKQQINCETSPNKSKSVIFLEYYLVFQLRS